MIVIVVSPAMGAPSVVAERSRCGWSGAGAQQLGAQDRLGQAELTVQLLGGRRLGGEVDDDVDALGASS